MQFYFSVSAGSTWKKNNNKTDVVQPQIFLKSRAKAREMGLKFLAKKSCCCSDGPFRGLQKWLIPHRHAQI